MKRFDKYSTRSSDYHFRQINKWSLKSYNAQVAARFETLVENVEKVAKIEGFKLLDVGCGDGVALYLLRDRLPRLELCGVDPSEEALAVARQKVSDAELKKSTSGSLPFEDDLFDVVISSDVIEHVEDPEQMLKEIKRVAKNGAVIIIGTPIKHSKFPIDHNHVQEFFAEDFLEMMQKHFQKCELHESHNLVLSLLYNAPTKSFFNFKYLINLLSLVLNWNPFRAERWNRIQMFAYMYVICKK